MTDHYDRRGNYFIRLPMYKLNSFEQRPTWILIDGPWFKNLEGLSGGYNRVILSYVYPPFKFVQFAPSAYPERCNTVATVWYRMRWWNGNPHFNLINTGKIELGWLYDRRVHNGWFLEDGALPCWLNHSGYTDDLAEQSNLYSAFG